MLLKNVFFFLEPTFLYYGCTEAPPPAPPHLHLFLRKEKGSTVEFAIVLCDSSSEKPLKAFTRVSTCRFLERWSSVSPKSSDRPQPTQPLLSSFVLLGKFFNKSGAVSSFIKQRG